MIEHLKQIKDSLSFREHVLTPLRFSLESVVLFSIGPWVADSWLLTLGPIYERNVTRALQRWLETGMTVYVVGAHVGTHAMQAAKIVGQDGTVFAFEAWPETFKRLQHNAERDPALARVITPVNRAVASSPGTVNFTRGNTDRQHHLTRTGETATTRVSATTLDAFWQATGQAPDLVLVDVEGNEPEVLRGGQELLGAQHPVLILEHHDKVDELTQQLTGYDYAVERLGRHLRAVRHDQPGHPSENGNRR